MLLGVIAAMMYMLLSPLTSVIRLIPNPGCRPTPSTTSTTSAESSLCTEPKDAHDENLLEWARIQRKLEEETNDLRNLVESCQDIYLRCDRIERHIQELRSGIEPLASSITPSAEPRPAGNASKIPEPTSTSPVRRRRPKLRLSEIPQFKEKGFSIPSSSPTYITTHASKSSSYSYKRYPKSSSSHIPRDVLQAVTSDFCFYVLETPPSPVASSRHKLTRLDCINEGCCQSLNSAFKVSSVNISVPVTTQGASQNAIWHPISVRDAKVCPDGATETTK
ncbi:hypothetical protein VNI00_010786 [Paramarasmius palmivorus]|uniref:Uncharacterized protein n=1 Tax=Paramarasmius palmivorus TaxID=297713 RepID=A0AAW0CH88_9AGAR